MANAMYQQGKDGTLFGQYANNAKDALKKWKNRISSGEFIVFTEKKQDGERATTMDMLFSVLQAVNKDKFQRCLEAAYSVLPTMYTPSALKLGVECGATRTTRQTFSSGNVNTKLETALKEAWDDPAYWQTHPNLLISQIKMDVDKLIHTAFDKESGRVSIRAIYDMLKAKPYGFMPCNMTAFIMGFVLKEYTNGSYSWSDGLTNDVMDLNKLKEMVNEIISLQITPNPRYKDNPSSELTSYCKVVFSKGVNTICYLTDNTQKEQETIFAFLDKYGLKLARNKLMDILSKVYPALYQYLLPYRFGNALLDQYFQDYKYQKVINKILPEFVSQVEDQAEKRE